MAHEIQTSEVCRRFRTVCEACGQIARPHAATTGITTGFFTTLADPRRWLAAVLAGCAATLLLHPNLAAAAWYWFLRSVVAPVSGASIEPPSALRPPPGRAGHTSPYWMTVRRVQDAGPAALATACTMTLLVAWYLFFYSANPSGNFWDRLAWSAVRFYLYFVAAAWLARVARVVVCAAAAELPGLLGRIAIGLARCWLPHLWLAPAVLVGWVVATRLPGELPGVAREVLRWAADLLLRGSDLLTDLARDTTHEDVVLTIWRQSGCEGEFQKSCMHI